MNHFKLFLFLTTFITLSWSCTKESIPTLTYPTSFKFNTPSMENRSVFKIDSSYVNDPNMGKQLVWKFRKLGDTLGSYDISNEAIADTLNYLIREEFSKIMISKITLLSASQMEIQYSVLVKDSLSPLNDKLELLSSKIVDYQQVGNFLAKGMYINNDFKEIYICNEFILATKRISNTETIKKYYQNLCSGVDPVSSLERFVKDYKDIKYDTASIEYVNYIFSSFK